MIKKKKRVRRILIGFIGMGLVLIAVGSVVSSLPTFRWTSVQWTKTGSPIFLTRKKLSKDTGPLIASLSESSQRKLFQAALKDFKGGTKKAPASAELVAEAKTDSPFAQWLYDQSTDRRFAEKVIRAGGVSFVKLINENLSSPDGFVRTELLRICLGDKLEIDEKVLRKLLAERVSEINYLTLTYLAWKPSVPADLKSEAVHLALQSEKPDKISCLGLKMAEHRNEPESQKAAEALVTELATENISELKDPYSVSLMTSQKTCSLDLLLGVLGKEEAAGKAARNTKLNSLYLAAKPEFQKAFAYAIAQEGELRTEFGALVVPYWRSAANRILTGTGIEDKKKAAPDMVLAAGVLALNPSPEDAKLILQMAKPETPEKAGLLAVAVSALGKTGTFSENLGDLVEAFSGVVTAEPARALASEMDKVPTKNESVDFVAGILNAQEAGPDTETLSELTTSLSKNPKLFEALSLRWLEKSPEKLVGVLGAEGVELCAKSAFDQTVKKIKLLGSQAVAELYDESSGSPLAKKLFTKLGVVLARGSADAPIFVSPDQKPVVFKPAKGYSATPVSVDKLAAQPYGPAVTKWIEEYLEGEAGKPPVSQIEAWDLGKVGTFIHLKGDEDTLLQVANNKTVTELEAWPEKVGPAAAQLKGVFDRNANGKPEFLFTAQSCDEQGQNCKDGLLYLEANQDKLVAFVR